MNSKKILCPIDFSEFNQLANEFASEFAAANNVSIVYLTVPEQGVDDYSEAMQRNSENAMKKLIQYRPTRPDVQCSHEVRISNRTGKTIVDYAKDRVFSLIVMATHGRTGLRRLLMGSVAEYVVRHAKCPVLTIKPPSESSSTEQKLAAEGMKA